MLKTNKKSKSSFVYRERSAESVDRRAAQTGRKFDRPFNPDFPIYTPKEGDNTVRFLPATFEGDHFGLDVWVHHNVGPDNSTYLCLEHMKKKRCPVCDKMREAANLGDTEEAKKYKPVQKVLCWVLDRNADDAETPKLYANSVNNDATIAHLSKNRRTGAVIAVDHDEEGYDVSFRRVGKGLHTRYPAFQIDRDATPILDDPATMEEVLEFISANPLPSVLNFYDAQYLERVQSGVQEVEDEDLEKKDEKPKAKPKGRTDEDSEDDEDEFEDEDETEEDTDDDDDGDSEEEDESEKEEDEEDEEADDEPKRGVSKKRRAGGSSGKTKRR